MNLIENSVLRSGDPYLSIDEMYDVIIVGAGLSGLASAWKLRDKKILLLEKEANTGGRVETRINEGVCYDVGAIFGFSPKYLPFSCSLPDLITEPSCIGIRYNGKTILGGSVQDCLDEIDPFLSLQAQIAIEQRRINSDDEEYHLLNAFFKVIHPGEMKDYVGERYRDAWSLHETRHFQGGNRIIPDLFLERLKKAGIEPVTEALVTKVLNHREKVCIEFAKNGVLFTTYSKAVIITVPSPYVQNILPVIPDDLKLFLDLICYRPGITVVFGLKGAFIKDFSYIVVPDGPISTVIKQNTGKTGYNLLVIYYAGQKADLALEMDDDKILAEAWSTICLLEIGEIKQSHKIFQDIKRWEAVGPVITEEMVKEFRPEVLRPFPGIYLAGEWGFVERENPMPYGMSAAVISGIKQAAAVRRLHGFGPGPDTWNYRYLTDVWVYDLFKETPRFVRKYEAGNIAFYGIVLQASHDRDLKKYLIENSQEGLWEYQNGFGVTAEDTLPVLEGLISCKSDDGFIRKSAEQLIKTWYNVKEGAFNTICKSENKYWLGPSIDATANAGYLLGLIDSERYSPVISSCRIFVSKNQKNDGLWQGKWFPSQMITTLYAVRLLIEGDEYAISLVERATSSVLSSFRNGTVNSSVIDTSAALLILSLWYNSPYATGSVISLKEVRTALISGIRFLKLACPEGLHKGGEPVLYYLVKKTRERSRLYHSVDKGLIAGAWAAIAIRESGVI